MANRYSPTLDTLQSFLEKARRRLSDEAMDDYEEMDQEDADRENRRGELSEYEKDDADKWLEMHDPDMKSSEEEIEDRKTQKKLKPAPKQRTEEEEEDEADSLPAELGVDDTTAPPEQGLDGTEKPVEADEPDESDSSDDLEDVDVEQPTTPQTATSSNRAAPTVRRKTPSANRDEDPLQPTREEILAMREYTRPWEQRARDHEQLTAEAHVNPVKHQRGRVVEAGNLAYADRKAAYDAFTASPEYKNADPFDQMDMDAKFHTDWLAANPDHSTNAINAISAAHKKGLQARQLFEQEKDEKIKHIAGGGVQPEAYSMEEGLQHAGGSREEEDSTPSGITQDPAAQFAAGNKEFVDDYMRRYKSRAGQSGDRIDKDAFNNEVRASLDSVLHQHPALRDPAKQARANQFMSRYHKTIRDAAKHVVNKLGLQNHVQTGKIDMGMLEAAGMHAVFQAVNDYDHDHHKAAKFTTHLNRKLHGLMQTALKTYLTEVPEVMRNQAKRFDQKQGTETMAPVKITDSAGNTRAVGGPSSATPATSDAAPTKRASHEIAADHPPEVQDRLRRVAAAKPTVRPAQTRPPIKKDVRRVDLSGEEAVADGPELKSAVERPKPTRAEPTSFTKPPKRDQ